MNDAAATVQYTCSRCGKLRACAEVRDGRGKLAVPVACPACTGLASVRDVDAQWRLDARRVTLAWKSAVQPKAAQRDSEDLPLFGGERQSDLF